MKLKHYFKTIILILIVAMTATSTKAVTEKYYSIFGNGVLTIYYGNPTTAQTQLSTYHDLSSKMDYQFQNASYGKDIKKVVIDPSMRSHAPGDFNYWFRNLQNLEEVKGLGFISTKNITILDAMFDYCINLRDIEFTSTYSGVIYRFQTSGITSMFGMFSNCKSLRTLDLSTFDTKNVTRTGSMFQYCSSLQAILVSSNWDMSQVTGNNGKDMFYGCTSLCGKIKYSSSKTDQTYANTNNYLLPHTNTKNSYATMYNSTTLMFCNDNYYNPNSDLCFELNSGDNEPGWISNAENITKVVFDPSFNNVEPTSCYKWFSGCKNLTTIDGINYFHFSSNTKNTAYMFYNCESLTKLQLLGSVYKVTDFSYMFSGCSNLATLKLPSRQNYADNPNCTMANMFAGCKSLTTINFLDGFYTNKAYDMSNMFSGCSGIRNFSSALDAAKCLITNMCTNMQGMFYKCSGATDFSILKLFNTKLVTNMEQMFMGCENITELRLEKFNTSKVTSIKAMFAKCTNLKTIYVSDGWSTQNVTDDRMCFANSPNIVGGKGTTFSSASGSYARIDQGASDPGYFTPYSSTITYILNGGSMGGNPFSYTVENATFQINNPSRTGYIFDGWSGTGIDGLSKSVKIKQGSTYPREYTAHWTCDLTSTSNTVKLVPSAEYYDNTPITLTVTVNGTTLRENIDFTTSNPIPVVNESGTYTVTITGIGDYTGTKSVSITIDALIDVTVTPDALSKTYGEDDPTEFTYTTVGLKSGDKLEGSLSRQSGEDAGQYLITGTLTNKKYRVTIDEVMFTINAKTVTSPTILLESEVYVFNDEAIEPRVSVFDGTTLISSNEYTVVYQNNIAIGTGNIVIVDKTGGNYTVSSSKDFQIVDKASAIEVTLITSEGNQTIYAVSGQKLTRPIREGYTAYLYTDADKTIEWDYDTDVITAPVTLYLELEPNLHYIKFNIDGAYPLSITSIYYGEEITLPTLGKPGYTFTWLDTPPATMPDKDLEIRGTYTINKHNLVYLLDGKEYSSEQVEYDTPLTLKANPAARTGYKFSGWSSLPATMPDKNVTISGSYIPNKHTITFNIDGESIVVETAYKASIASLFPKKPGFKFVPSTTIESTMPDIDLIVSGKWEIRTYTLSFYADGKECQTVTLHYGDKIEPIAAPVKEGYVFMGWNDLPATMPDNDMMVFGSFKKDDNVTPVSSITNAPSVKVWAYNRTIYIETAPDSQYKIIDLQGRIITTSTTKSSHNEIHINQSGILIVIIGNQSFKLSL
ncbi:MAG: BspA family leucine-rich repeat surface protein [Bacteroidales bacterium]|nr:BspA family leucine-rich repeat surface protein [Bacteroidales bacterium]